MRKASCKSQMSNYRRESSIDKDKKWQNVRQSWMEGQVMVSVAVSSGLDRTPSEPFRRSTVMCAT